MKARYGNRRQAEPRFVRTFSFSDVVRNAVALTKEAVLREYGSKVAEHGRLLRLALTEAEALAWQTEHPHLFFPALAHEKAEATVSWHRHQRSVRGGREEMAFAE